jgi:hypothetical protein
VRLGNTAKDIIQVDLMHLSWFLVSRIGNQIFD